MEQNRLIPQFLIAAPSSNSGKTTLTLGLLKALSNQGLKVQAFKCGPDYIDPILHRRASGFASINIDTFMASSAHAKSLYAKYTNEADTAVIEGVMGLFDGAYKMKGSGAEIASMLNIPVILVVDARAMAYSAAALIYGFKNFCKDIHLAGVIFNRVKTSSHYSFLVDACTDAGVEALGYLTPQENIEIPSRHLGLSIDTQVNIEAICSRIADALQKTVDIPRLLELTSKPVPALQKRTEPSPGRPERIRIAVAKDEAFSFTYQENLEAFKEVGEVVFFSPLHDKRLPECDLLYLAGGYPELFLEQLSQNLEMLLAVRTYCGAGGRTLAECGGMMYLGESIMDQAGESFPMVGFLPLSTSMVVPKLHLGYREMVMEGLHIKGHEFHYSSCSKSEEVTALECKIMNAKGAEVDTKIFKIQSTIASYIHFYWAEDPSFLKGLFGLSNGS
ncbi:cobyrinate a,c-diamide synthase [Desertivirga brevis]|uniref:cobyrinate a,c-diamide synthase n=1 Tax=Desertivirga brevis TaxID=2810310 RepID=UPI001A9769CB|nr:cobyrinate a,c-diamide synthase [Pedobacter sp. SYSU D00873]